MSRAVIRQFVNMVSAETGNQWCNQPAFCGSSLSCNMFGKRIYIFAIEALGLTINVVIPFAMSC